MIIDAHAHLGWDQVFEEDFAEEELLESQAENGIDLTIVQPALCHELETVMAQHDNIFRLVNQYPGRFVGMANPNPHLSEDKYRSELIRCVKELRFVGVKIHPYAHGLSPNSQAGRMVFDLAQELDIPVMIHTGAGIPWALPSLIAPVARDYPDVKVVMAHSGHMLMAAEAADVAAQCDNVFLEVSWTGGFLVRNFVRRFGAGRVMFASDHADNAATELTKMRTAKLTESELEWCLGKTAASVYGLQV